MLSPVNTQNTEFCSSLTDRSTTENLENLINGIMLKHVHLDEQHYSTV